MTSPTHSPAARASSASRKQFAADVQYYLTHDPRQLPSRYLYDDLGSALFEAICRLPWYPLKRAESSLLEAHAREILDDCVSTVVELGPGSGDKLLALVATASRRSDLRLDLIDVSRSALATAAQRLAAAGCSQVVTHEVAYERGLEAFAAERRPGRSLALFLGSNIGNFDPPAREAFLRLVRRSLRAGDGLLLGADLTKPEAQLLLAYDDPLGVTAAFNRNLLVRINRELGGNFDVGGFAHRAVWNRHDSRVEMHLVSTRVHDIHIPDAELDIRMPAGESIWTESSYKFDAAEILSLLELCGFRVGAQWIDASARFALTYGEAV